LPDERRERLGGRCDFLGLNSRRRTDAFDTTFGGHSDGYLTKLSMLPMGVSRYGNSTEGCAGFLAMGATAMPRIGKPFSMTCSNAPPSSTQGTLVLGLGDLSQR
jgi:hypothetical protein